MPQVVKTVLLLVVVSALAGCFGGKTKSRYCHSSSEYQRAESIDPLQMPVDLQKPESPTRIRVPEGPRQTEPTPRGEPCLDTPPSIYTESVPDAPARTLPSN